MVKPVNKSPQIGVRFKEDEMTRLRERARKDYAGNVSTLVKVAVRRLLGDDPTESDPSQKTEAAA